MLIVGDNLNQLNLQCGITDGKDDFDNTCLKIRLGQNAKKFIPGKILQLTYGQELPSDCEQEIEIPREGLLIQKNTGILAYSEETIKMPLGYFGLVQTKGTLARMLVSLTFSDGKIDPGYDGKLTFEIYNASCYDVLIPKLEVVGNIYIFKTSTKII
jgi:deoxycytidine triphosphate deaminase